MADDKTQRIVEAARRRTRAEKEVAERNSPADDLHEMSDEERASIMEGAQEMADLKVQPRAGTIDGDIDLEARGDVKGDGDDAKNYPDGDPDKYVSPTTAEYGLNEDTVRGPYFGGTTAVGDGQVSERTRAEMSRGKEALGGRSTASRSPRTRTVITDDDGDDKAAKARADAKARREAEEKAKADEKK